MTEQEFDRLCMRLVRVVRDRAPKDTGNLAYNGIRYEWRDKETFVIYVDGEPPNKGIAPYMPYTNEPWISKRWNGKPNPNQGWWQDAVQLCVDYILNEYKGEIND